jgi:hypothetical protein
MRPFCPRTQLSCCGAALWHSPTCQLLAVQSTLQAIMQYPRGLCFLAVKITSWFVGMFNPVKPFIFCNFSLLVKVTIVSQHSCTSTISRFLKKGEVTVAPLFYVGPLGRIYFRLKCNLLSHQPSSLIHVSALYGHHLAKIVALYVKITYRVWTQYFIIKIN